MSGGRRGLVAHAALAACVIAALVALAWAGSRGDRADADGAKPEAGSDESAMSDEARRLAASVGDVPARDSSAAAFLADLAEAGREDRAAVAWESEAGLTGEAAGVLGSYRDAGGVELAASGYLDLKGNAWGALLRGDAGWVDVVTVWAASADDRDRGSRVRIVRLLPVRGEGD